MKKTFQEFKEFALKGNVIDMAVGIIIGAAFGRVVSSLVNDILMPPLGYLLGRVDFKDLKIVLHKATPAIIENNKIIQPEIPAVTLNYGMFIQNMVDFLIIAFALFLVLKFIMRLQKQKEKPQPTPTTEEVILTEIRDLLRSMKENNGTK